MLPRSPKLLEDIADACGRIAEITSGITPADFARDWRIHQVVERNIEIIGEALLRMERADFSTASRITDYRQVIGLRNRLVHGYDDIDRQRVWEILQRSLPILERDVRALLDEAMRGE